MFNCLLGKHKSNSGEKLVKVVTKKRERIYKNRDTDRESKGWEVVEEVNACQKHATEHAFAELVTSTNQ